MRIIVEVEGGMVQTVYVDGEVDVVSVLDHDCKPDEESDESEREFYEEMQEAIKGMTAVY